MNSHPRFDFFPKKIFSLVLCLGFSCLPPAAKSQTAQLLDSLRRAADTASTLEIKIHTNYWLGERMRSSKPDSTRQIGEWLVQFAAKNKSQEAAARGHNLLGVAYNNLGDSQKSLENFEKSIQIWEKIGDKTQLAYLNHQIAYPLVSLTRFAEALEYEFRALELATALRDSSKMANCYTEMGRIYGYLGKNDEAISFVRKGLDINLATGKTTYYSYARLAKIYSDLGKLDSSILLKKKALEAAQKMGNRRTVAVEKNNIAEDLLKKGAFAAAKTLFLESLQYFENINERYAVPLIYCNLARLETKQGNHAVALAHTQKALDATGNLDNPDLLSEIHDLRATVFAALGDFQNAYRSSRKFEALNDSLLAAQKTEETENAAARFRTNEQKTQIAEQNLQIERQKNRNRLLAAAAILALLAGLGFAFFLREKRRRAELALRLEKTESDKLREIDSVKSAFFANISHEFRTPLTLLLMPLQEMEAGTFRGDLKKYYGIMRRNAARLLQLVNQLLDLSRLENGKLQIQNAPGDLHRMLRAVAGSFESLAAAKQIDFQINIPAAPFFVNFDADKLEKIAANLLSNAFKFTPEEGQVVFEISSPENSGQTQIRVSDTGIGIAAEQVPHIFERFYQVENSGADIQPGSGIGLALTKELVELHGGKIGVESVENQGTTFTTSFVFEKTNLSDDSISAPVAFPRLKSEVSEKNGLKPLEPQDYGALAPAVSLTPDFSAGKLTAAPLVLVAEDNPDVRAYIVEYLQEKYQILEARDGREALELATESIPDLILTDLMMPGLNGTELTKKLKNDVRTHHIPVVMLTAKSGRDDKISGIETGAEAYLTKPFDGDELRGGAQNLLAQRQILQEKFSHQIRLETSKTEAVSLDDQFLQRILAEIEANLDDETFGVEPLASAVAMSRSNLFRKLDALLGKSPNQLIRERRLLRAKSLLEQGAGSSTEVAFMTGFNTPSYFAKCFFEMFGVAPGAVGRKMREETV